MERTQIKRPVYDNHLPPAACTTEMLEQLETFAKSEQTSMSAVIRHAVALFLASENRKTSQKIEKQTEEGAM